MKLHHTHFYLLILLITIGCDSQKIEQERFPAEELITDINEMFQILEQVHPDLYSYTSMDDIYKRKSKIKERINTSLTRVEFYKLITPLVTSLGDAHTGMNPFFEEVKRYRNDGGLLFPFDIFIRNDRIFVIEYYSNIENVEPGSEILSINGYQSYDIIQTMLQYTHGDRDAIRYEIIARRYFPILLWLLYELDTEFNVRYKCPLSGNIREEIIEGESYAVLSQKRPESRYDFTFSHIPEQKTGIIELRNMHGRTVFDAFLKDTFNELKDEEVEHLIIDISNNGGGDPAMGEMLWYYLTEIPYKSQSYSNFNKEINNNPLQFNGELYLLTGRITYSSAIEFAAKFKDHRIGTILGEETGGLATHFTRVVHFTLSLTKLEGIVSSYKYIRPSGIDDGRGVLPDIEVIADVDDIINGRNPALDYALNLIKDK